MERLTKAAIATGGAAVLLLGGAGTMAYWTASGTATAPAALTSGNLKVTGTPSCSAWSYSATTADPVTAIVPGDTVYTTCTVEVTGKGDHLSILASSSGGGWTTPSDPLPTELTLTPGAVTVDGTAAAGGIIDASGWDGTTAHAVTVQLTAVWPYGGPVSTPDPATGADNANTMDATAALNNVVITFVQQDPNATP